MTMIYPEIISHLGSEANKQVTRIMYDVLKRGTTGTYAKDTNDYDSPLIICPSGGKLAMCNECPCNEPHYEWECMTDAWGPECCYCEPLDDHQRHECDDMYEETHPVLIGDLRKPRGYGDISPLIAAYAARYLLKRSHPDIWTEKFGNVTELPYDDEVKNHMIDAYLYGTGATNVYYDQATKKVTGKNPDGSTYPVALRQIEVQPKEKTQARWRDK